MIRPRNWKEWIVVAIAAITILTALGQIAAPETALNFMGVTPSAETVFLFRLTSLFTGLFGGMLFQSRLSGRDETTILLWVSLQKILGSIGLALGALNGTLSTQVLVVAAYDFIAGLFLAWYWRDIPAQASP